MNWFVGKSNKFFNATFFSHFYVETKFFESLLQRANTSHVNKGPQIVEGLWINLLVIFI